MIDALKKNRGGRTRKSARQRRRVLLAFVGPVPWETSGPGAQAVLIGEPNVQTDRPVNVGKETFAWQPYMTVDPDGEVDFGDIFGSLEAKTMYAYTEVTFPKAGEAILAIGSNDGHICWLNGEEVGRFAGESGRRYVASQDKVKVQVKEGTNTLLLKVMQIAGSWGFNARFLTTDDQPVPVQQTTP